MEKSDKKQLLNSCLRFVEQRMEQIRKGITDLEEALKLETKCSMGDKYETGRAMLHLEFEKLAGQMEQYAKLRKTLSLISPERSFEKVGFGSAVTTNHANYFIAIPAGKIELEGKIFFAVGAAAPIAQMLSGRTAGEEVLFNGQKIKIQTVF